MPRFWSWQNATNPFIVILKHTGVLCLKNWVLIIAFRDLWSAEGNCWRGCWVSTCMCRQKMWVVLKIAELNRGGSRVIRRAAAAWRRDECGSNRRKRGIQGGAACERGRSSRKEGGAEGQGMVRSWWRVSLPVNTLFSLHPTVSLRLQLIASSALQTFSGTKPPFLFFSTCSCGSRWESRVSLGIHVPSGLRVFGHSLHPTVIAALAS